MNKGKVKSKIKEVKEKINKELDDLEAWVMSQPPGPGSPPPKNED